MIHPAQCVSLWAHFGQSCRQWRRSRPGKCILNKSLKNMRKSTHNFADSLSQRSVETQQQPWRVTCGNEEVNHGAISGPQKIAGAAEYEEFWFDCEILR